MAKINKRGFVEAIPQWVIAVAVLVIMIIIYYIMVNKGGFDVPSMP